MRVMTYNIRHAQGGDGWVSSKRIARVVAEAQADVIGMNEVWRLGRYFDQPAALGRHLGLDSAFVPNPGFGLYRQGNLVLTRGAIKAVDNLAVPGGLERRGCLLVRVEIDGEEVVFGSAHLALGRRARASQLAYLAETLPVDVPLVLTGDMNCSAAELGPLSAVLNLAEAPPSFPALLPMRALDHIAFSDHWRLESVNSPASNASDHRPVVADLTRV